MADKATLVFVHDPMCSWCWAFRPVWTEITQRLPASISTRRLVGGLAPDSKDPMPLELQQKLQLTWQTIQQKVPGTQFNFGFWEQCSPKRSTYPACRAIIAACEQDALFEEPMILAIQQAYYLQSRNPSERSTLIELADEIGLDVTLFAKAIDSKRVQDELIRQIREGRSMGANGFPSLVLEQADQHQLLQYSYTDPSVVLSQLM